MRGRPSGLVESARGEANRILSASALSSMRIICLNRVSRHDWIIAVSLGCFVSLNTSSFRTNWYHFMPSSICKHYWCDFGTNQPYLSGCRLCLTQCVTGCGQPTNQPTNQPTVLPTLHVTEPVTSQQHTHLVIERHLWHRLL